MTEEDKKDYAKIAAIILRHYQLTPEAYRLKFKTASKKPDETFEEFATRLTLYFRRWLKPSDESDTSQDVNRMMKLQLIDQFLTSLQSEHLRTKLRDICGPSFVKRSYPLSKRWPVKLTNTC